MDLNLKVIILINISLKNNISQNIEFTVKNLNSLKQKYKSFSSIKEGVFWQEIWYLNHQIF